MRYPTSKSSPETGKRNTPCQEISGNAASEIFAEVTTETVRLWAHCCTYATQNNQRVGR